MILLGWGGGEEEEWVKKKNGTHKGPGSRLSGKVSSMEVATKVAKPGFLFNMMKKSSLSFTISLLALWIRNLPSIARFCTRLMKSFRRIVLYLSSFWAQRQEVSAAAAVVVEEEEEEK